MNIRLTIVLPEDHTVDLGPVLSQAIKFERERMDVKHHKSKHRVKETSVRKTIMDHYTHGARFAQPVAEKWVTAGKYNPASANSALSSLVKDGYVKRISKGVFEFVKPMKDGEK